MTSILIKENIKYKSIRWYNLRSKLVDIGMDIKGYIVDQWTFYGVLPEDKISEVESFPEVLEVEPPEIITGS